MKILSTDFPGLKVVEPTLHQDERGYFFESYRTDLLAEAGIHNRFVQDNLSRSTHGVLRGLHYQLHHGQGKLVSCTKGDVFDVALDVRRNSPTFGQVFAVTLSEKNHRSVYIPPGFAHGFCVVSAYAIFQYKCTTKYMPEDEYGIVWNDAELGIEWPVDNPILSDRDQRFPTLSNQEQTLLPEFGSS